LTEEERSLLRVLEGALRVSEYTDKVDIFSYRSNKFARVVQQLGDVFAIISGMLVAANGKRGQDLIQDRQVSENPELFASIFEVGRRYKIMNPDKMRSNYGKLMYMLQDASAPEVRDAIGFRCVRTVVTVDAELTQLGATELLDDDDLAAAVSPVLVGDSLEDKQAAVERLKSKYAGETPSGAARIERVLLSIADDESLTIAHVSPVEQVLELLHANFDPSTPEKGSSLAIQAGRNGARLTHDHATQFAYVEQSLLLWREILGQLSKMWCLAEADLLDGNGYRLRDTGQGVHRVQSAPHVGRFMHAMLSRMDDVLDGGWVGSSAVHLGDNDVPNALVWIDKYTQIPRILIPLVQALDDLEPLVSSAPGVSEYLKALYGTTDNCKRAVLCDFFRHAFDGSGADNFYDAGSCIDGRLTSAWNWCSKLSKKPYYHLFKSARPQLPPARLWPFCSPHLIPTACGGERWLLLRPPLLPGLSALPPGVYGNPPLLP
jgi:hypothetical protein